MGKKAFDIVASGKTVSSAQASYLLGNKTPEQLREYITLNEKAGVFDNAKLIDEYVDQLSVRSFQDYSEVLFILKAGPWAFGKAYHLCFTNSIIVDSIYRTEPSEAVSAINQHIITNTYDEAVRRKDAAMAQQAANYLAGTWRSNPRQANISSQNEMLKFYSAIADTARYYRLASSFYDSYYMNISADSARKKDALSLEEWRKRVLAKLPVETTITPGGANGRTSMSVNAPGSSTITSTGSPSNSTALVLNNGAYQFYTLGTRNQLYLRRAISWSRRSIELDAKPGHYDTLAHLLYRLDFFDEAVTTQGKAVSLAASNGTDKAELEKLKAELVKIKQRKLQ